MFKEDYNKYYLLEKFNIFCKKYSKWKKSLFIGSISFEKRCLNAFKIISNYPGLKNQIKFILYKVKKHSGPDFEEMDENLEINLEEFLKIDFYKSKKIKIKDYDIFDKNKNLMGYDIIRKDLEEIKEYFNDVFFDISSFPRSVFFPIIKILTSNMLFNNIYILWTEKKGLKNERNVLNYTQKNKIPLFPKPVNNRNYHFFYLPILGYDNTPIKKLFLENFFDIYPNKYFYPIITFPSKWPEETDNILVQHLDFFTEGYTNEIKDVFDLSNLILVPSNNPFELYLKIKRFKENKIKVYNNCNIALSPFGTKAQSLGVCLSSILLDLDILYYNPEFYKLSKVEKSPDSKYEDLVGETFISLIKGDLYED